MPVYPGARICRFSFVRQLEPLWAALDNLCADGVRSITLRELARVAVS